MKAFLFCFFFYSKISSKLLISTKVITSAEINIYQLCLVVFLLENFCKVKQISRMAFVPFATFCMSVTHLTGENRHFFSSHVTSFYCNLSQFQFMGFLGIFFLSRIEILRLFAGLCTTRCFTCLFTTR